MEPEVVHDVVFPTLTGRRSPPPRRPGIRRLPRATALVATLALLAAGCGGSVEDTLATAHNRDLSPGERCEAIRDLPDEGVEAVEPLHALAGDPSAKVAECARKALARVDDPDAAAALVDLLRDDDPGVVASAAEALGLIGDPDTARPLARLLDSRNSAVLTAALHALAWIGDPQAVAAIEELALRRGATPAADRAGREVRRMAVYALGEIGDRAARRVRVGAGVRWQDVVPMLSDLGLAALHGSSPLVGIAGYSLGGGMGWLARKHGLQTNSLTALELVTADGRHRRVDTEHDPDLFWALRGGNGNFGVVTALEFEVYPVTELYAGAMFFPVTRADEVLRAWTGITAILPEEMMTWTSLLHFPDVPDVPEPLRGRPFTVFHGAYLGDERHGTALLRAVRELGPEIDTFAMVPPAALADMAMDPSEPLPFQSTTALLGDLPAQGLEDLLAAVGPGSGSPLPLVQVRHLGGALSRRTPGAGARDVLPGEFCVFALGVVVDEPSAAEVASYLQRLDVATAPYRVGEYPNFVERPADTRAFFTPETWERLRRVKADHDPRDLFRGNHHIPRALLEHAVAAG